MDQMIRELFLEGGASLKEHKGRPRMATGVFAGNRRIDFMGVSEWIRRAVQVEHKRARVNQLLKSMDR